MNLPIVPQTMGYHAARILLKDGKITHRANDVICYGSRFGRKFYIDQRTKHNPDPTPDVVHALGRTSNMHWLYVCPDCGMIHSVFQPNIRHVGLVRCKNEASFFRRYFIGPDAKAHLIPAKQVKLITEQFDFN